MEETDLSQFTNPYLSATPPTEFTPVFDLSQQAARKEAEQLREAIHEHDRRYYVENNPLTADATYDTLFARLQTLEAEFGLESPDSPTQRVGGKPVDEFETVTHPEPLLSTQQSKEETAVREFHQRVQETLRDADVSATPLNYVCEPKFDGISLVLTYEDQTLARAVTRGDGTEGEDVTQNAQTIQTIPLQLPADAPDQLVVRGEVVMPTAEFQAYNKKRLQADDDPFANPRNATAGTIRQQDPTVVAQRPLAFYPFAVVTTSDPWETRIAEHRGLDELGFTVSNFVTHAETIDDAVAYRNKIHQQREADTLSVPVDGVVIKVNNHSQQDALGVTAHHPKYTFAYKFPPRTDETTVRDIIVQVGRTGRLTPVALLDPVDLSGVTISRASLHNPAQIAELGVAIGDKVAVERAGEVIPQVTDVVSEETDGVFDFPDACPVCESAVTRDGPMAFCTGGLGCAAQQKQSLMHYASRSGVDIDGLGEQTITQFWDAELVRQLPDLYRLSEADIQALDGFGETSAANICQAINDATTPPLPDFVTALGIPQVGETTARALATEFETIDALAEASAAELTAVPDIGPITADLIREFFTNETNKRIFRELREFVTPQRYTQTTSDDGAFTDTKVVFTGSLPNYTRNEATEIVERQGGSVTSSVSSVTDLLVVGNGAGQRKQTAADTNDVKTIDAETFEQKVDSA